MAMRGVHEQPEGLLYQAELITAEDEAALLDRLAGSVMEPVVMHGVESRRRVLHFGLRYEYSSLGTTPTDPIPDFLVDLRARSARLAGVHPSALVEALVTRYPPGASIGWHRDAAVFGAVVVGVSLGSDSVIRFQRRTDEGERRVFEQPLARRSAYVLVGESRSVWQHSVPPVKEERWSVTFRPLRRTDT